MISVSFTSTHTVSILVTERTFLIKELMISRSKPALLLGVLRRKRRRKKGGTLSTADLFWITRQMKGKNKSE